MNATQLIAPIVPSGVVVVESTQTTDGALHPEEERALGRVCQKRRTEFTMGRRNAHAALRLLGHGDVPILPGPNREPRWPPERARATRDRWRAFAAAAVEL